MKNSLDKALMLFGLALTLAVMFNLVSWIAISSSSVPSRTFQQAQIEYLNHYPAFLRNARLLTWLYIGVDCLAIYAFAKISPISSKSIKLMRKVLVAINLIIISWQLFSLM